MTRIDSPKSQSSFDLFWEDSSYSRFNIKEFAVVQEQYSAKDKVESIIEYPSIPERLTLPKTVTNYLSKRRKSERAFSDKSLSKHELSILLSSFYGYNGLEHRSYPSAGGTYAVEVYCVANKVTGFNGKVLYYNPDVHAVSVIGDAPSWDKLSDTINVLATGVPQCVLIFVLIPDRVTVKYLERGGRFALIETGAAMQQLANQISGSKNLKGVAAGGMIDDFWLQTLGLNKNEAKIALGYLCGR
jgi:SagB-type dehydrogenase family enzyme